MKTVPIEELTTIKGIAFPAGENYRDIIVTGPPGSGKTTFITRLGGWPEEGYLDLCQKKWWRNRILTFRPREVHLGLPFHDHEACLSVFDRAWLEAPSRADFGRVRLPPEGKGMMGRDWRSKFVFDFQLPPAEVIYDIRKERKSHGTHPVDINLTLEIVRQQLEVHRELARFLHGNGLRVIVRESFQGEPRYPA